MTKELLNKRELASLLGISQSTVNRLVADKRIGYVRPTSGLKRPRIRFAPEHIDAFLRSVAVDAKAQ